MMFDYSNLKQLDAAFNSINPNFAYIINVANEHTAYSYEWSPNAVKKIATDQSGLLVSTNHFVSTEWENIDRNNNEDQTITRRNNLLNLANKNKGKIDVSLMQAILNTSIENGGATSFVSNGYELYTGFQVISIPKEQTLWVKIPKIQDWMPLNLGYFFKL
jgi:hypothetical protein